LTAYYESLRGKVSASNFEILQARVQLVGGAAVLTFNLVFYGDREDVRRWKCTEVYRRDPEGRRIVQTHRSFTGRAAAAR
jgi:hypothetical protein